MRICVLTAGHLSTCPRMLKAADALAADGHAVRVVSTRHVDWATTADEVARTTRTWGWRVVDYSGATGGALRVTSGARQRAARAVVSALGPARAPWGAAIRAFSRVHDDLVDAAVSEPVDVLYGGTTGALAATAEAARIAGVPFGLDLEDFHRAEQEGVEGAVMNAIAMRIETRVLGQALFLTAAGASIAREYRRVCGINAVPINNTFPLPAEAPSFAAPPDGRLRFYWFSQTIGPSRGLDEAIQGIGLAGIAATLTLRGREAGSYGERLRALAHDVAPGLDLRVLPPIPPDAMIDAAREFDVGLAVEQPVVRSRELCLPNKPLTYLPAGLATVFTATPGQRPLYEALGAGALVYEPGRPGQLVEGLRRWAADPASLVAAKRAAWDAARRRWHWEHPLERGALLDAVRAALSGTCASC